ncbi:MAG: glutaredoxin family protein [Candidatus Poribacteria bacterium]|nr:glutaredoxin family protein [Candidatus Poribacteria bacterium]
MPHADFWMMPLKAKPMRLQFYTKPDCPLCDEAKAVLQNIGAKASFITVEEIDITKDLRLFTKYKYRIPVLELDGQPLFTHHVTDWKLMWQLRWHRARRHFIGRRDL